MQTEYLLIAGLLLAVLILQLVALLRRPPHDRLEQAVRERFMNEKHLEMWSVADDVEDVLDKIKNAAPWSAEDRKFAAVN